MFTLATISCGCGCISRLEFQKKDSSFICPECKRTMDKNAYTSLIGIMAEFGEWNTEILKNAEGLKEPKMRAIALTIADLESNSVT